MELRHLRYFVAVAQRLSFRLAAQHLHVSQSALSRQVQLLEEELRLQLLQRNRRREVTLTAAGRSFLGDAQQILAGASAARARAHDAARGERSRLIMGNIASLCAVFIPGCLRAFRAKQPQVDVQLIDLSRAEQLVKLRESQLNFALFPSLNAPLEEGLGSQTVWSCPMVAVLPAGHPLGRVKNKAEPDIDLKRFTEEVLIVPAPEGAPGYTERLSQLCGATDFRPKAICPVDSMDNMLSMVAAGYGFAVLPQMMATVSPSVCVSRCLRAPVPPFRLKLFWRREALSGTMQSFIDVARDMQDL